MTSGKLLKQLSEARKRFNQRRQKCRLTFDDIKAQLERGKPLTHIALAAGISRARMQMIYKLWFRKILRLPNAKRRRHILVKAKRMELKRRLVELPDRPAIRAVAEAEGSRSVKPVPRDQHTRPGQNRVREILVHGRLCGVHHIKKIHRNKRSRTGLAITTIYRKAVERQNCKIFYIETGRGTKRVDLERDELLAVFKDRTQKRAPIYFRVTE